MAKTRAMGSVTPSVHWAAAVSRNPAASAAVPVWPDGSEAAVTSSGGMTAVKVYGRRGASRRGRPGAGGQVVAEAVGEQVLVGGEGEDWSAPTVGSQTPE